jgi:hypothetical protein
MFGTKTTGRQKKNLERFDTGKSTNPVLCFRGNPVVSLGLAIGEIVIGELKWINE